MKPIYTGALLFALCAGCAVGQLSAGPPPFAQLLHKAISGPSSYSVNTAFSPYSVGTALSMLRLGTTGPSRRQLRDALGRNYRTALQQNVQVPGVTVRLFNAFFHDRNLVVYSDYINEVKRRYGAVVETQAFAAGPAAAVDAINRRVEAETLGKIKNLVTAGDNQLVSVLVSAVYMKALWKQAFDPLMTFPGRFTTADDRQQKVMMMNAETECNYLQSNTMKAVALPYKDERFQMLLVLPDRSVNMSDITSSINVGAIYKDMRFQSVVLKFPKFRVESKLDLADTLKHMGVRDIFSYRASLQRMSPDRRLFVSQVRHSAVVEIDESGSEAAAATSISISARSFFDAPKPSFVANRPFLFYIYDVSTGNVLFSGHVADAAAAQAQKELSSSEAALGQEVDSPPGSHRRPKSRRFPAQSQFPVRRRPSSLQNEVDGREARQGQFIGGQRYNSRQWRDWQQQQPPQHHQQRQQPRTSHRPVRPFSDQSPRLNSRFNRGWRDPGVDRGQFSGGEPPRPEGQMVWPADRRVPQQGHRRRMMRAREGRRLHGTSPQTGGFSPQPTRRAYFQQPSRGGVRWEDQRPIWN